MVVGHALLFPGVVEPAVFIARGVVSDAGVGYGAAGFAADAVVVYQKGWPFVTGCLTLFAVGERQARLDALLICGTQEPAVDFNEEVSALRVAVEVAVLRWGVV